jgi:hypothetical protein
LEISEVVAVNEKVQEKAEELGETLEKADKQYGTRAFQALMQDTNQRISEEIQLDFASLAGNNSC